MLKRPTPFDNEDEILRQQDEFFKQSAENKIKPAAVVANSNEKEKKEIKQGEIKTDQNYAEDNVQNQIANTFEAIPTDMKINQVIEKQEQTKRQPVFNFDSRGFPKAVRRDPNIKPTRVSIFAQHIKRLKRESNDNQSESCNMDISETSLVVKEKNQSDTVGAIKFSNSKSICNEKELVISKFREASIQNSNILTSADKKSIHDENINKLKSMTEEEILSERERLLSSLDPALIQYLRSRKTTKPEENESRNPTIQTQNAAAESIDLDELEAPKEMLSKPESAGWINFNRFEASKLAWMKNITVPDLKKTSGFEARFDFDGYLLPYSVAQIDESNRHLYHHGDEPDRPGYTLQELLLLTRSNVVQQKVIALNTLANILSLDQTGIYDSVIDIPIEQVFFVIRFCLDDNTPSVLNSAIKALRNLVYYQIDDTCLDNLMSFGVGLVQPILAVDETKEDDNTVNDQQLAETNVIKCLIRTDILIRIRYIINIVKPPLETILYCIDILTRMARDSEFIINKILHCDGLLQNLTNYFLPHLSEISVNNENPGYNMPLPQTIKLIRILSSRSRTLADIILKRYGTLEIITSYLYEEYFSQNANGMKLQVECFHYWTLLLHYGLASDAFRQHEHLFLKYLDYHFKNTDNILSTTLIRQNHVSALLLLISKAVEKEHNLFSNIISECFLKWMNQYGTFEQFKCGHSQITSSILYCSATYNKNYNPIYSSTFLETFINSRVFDISTKNIINGSLLLNNYETHKTTANLKTLEAAAWFTMDHIVPVLQSNSCIPLLYNMSLCILSDSSDELKVKFLQHPNILDYTKKLKSAKYYFNVGNWFTRCESFFVMNLLKIAEKVRDQVDPALYYDIAVKCLCVFSAEQKKDMEFLLENIIFCPRFYPVEVAMMNTTISDRNNELDKAWRHLKDIKSVYSEVLGLTKDIVTLETTVSLDMSVGNVIPMDWIYTPLVLLYSTQQNRSKQETNNEEADFYIIINCLRWILIYEMYFESLAQTISPTEKYVRLGCLFLGSDNLFLNEEIQNLLTRIYGFLCKFENKLNFEQEISGLTNFKDFYVQLLEQYQAVSYGNKVFGNVLLFPLVKRHDIKYRKTLWSEYMGVVETFSVTKDEVWIDPENLIHPPEKDSSLCKCYVKALQSGAVAKRSVLYLVAETSAKNFKENLSKIRENRNNDLNSDISKMEI
ncbi:RNA polymerase II-associated protein 1 isoform X2 [Sitophilus oryzae]|uniref:RNA polymerase II-associated protein 1 isoform X2 n=1 Tax=Sitophilus oryzae TaxID=7048 RepID=A0A6J2YKQ9_SITOR|nr:RNA polymerase II-associated protein 1 isoform X2 [Sitophilus oryzae]